MRHYLGVWGVMIVMNASSKHYLGLVKKDFEQALEHVRKFCVAMTYGGDCSRNCSLKAHCDDAANESDYLRLFGVIQQIDQAQDACKLMKRIKVELTNPVDISIDEIMAMNFPENPLNRCEKEATINAHEALIAVAGYLHHLDTLMGMFCNKFMSKLKRCGDACPIAKLCPKKDESPLYFEPTRQILLSILKKMNTEESKNDDYDY